MLLAPPRFCEYAEEAAGVHRRCMRCWLPVVLKMLTQQSRTSVHSITLDSDCIIR